MRWNSDFLKDCTAFLRCVAVIGVLAVWLSTAHPPELSAAEPKPGRVWRKKANEVAARAEAAYNNHQFVQAARLFIEAYQIDWTGVDWLASAGRSFEDAGMLDQAANYYAAFIAAPGANPKNVKKARLHAADVDRLLSAKRLSLAQAQAAELERQRADAEAKRSAPPPAISAGPYRIDALAGTVLDTRTNLTWQRLTDGKKYTWPDGATSYCSALELVGAKWRVPNSTEFRYLIEDGPSPSRYESVFPDGHADSWFWTSSVVGGARYAHYAVNLGALSVSAFDFREKSFGVRCVR